MIKSGLLDYLIIGLYFLMIFGIGVWYSRREKSSEDFMLGGRHLPWWAVGISMMTALFSTISIVAAPGEAFSHGLTYAVLGLSLSLLAGVPAFYVFTRFYFRVKTFTPFQYLEHRYDSRIRTLASITYWMVRVVYLAIVLFSSAIIIEGAFGWPVWVTLLVMGSVSVAFTTMGGMKGVVWTDVIQFVIMAGGITLVIIKASTMIPGGLAGAATYAVEHGRGLQGVGDSSFYSLSPYVRLSLWGLLFSNFFTGVFQSSADQLSVQHLLSTSSLKQAAKSFWICTLLGALVCGALYFLGLVMFSFYSHNPPAEPIPGDKVLFRFISTHFSSPMPGLIISALLAAAMTTLNSGMNCLATVATKDIYLRHINANATEAQQVRFSRLVILAIGVLCVGLGLMVALVSKNIGETFLECGSIWWAFGGVIAPLYLIGVTTRRASARYMFVGMLSAWVVIALTVYWYVTTKTTPQPVSFILTGLLGSLFLTVWGYLPSIVGIGKVDPVKTDGLTLWTLDKRSQSEIDERKGVLGEESGLKSLEKAVR